MTGQHTSRRRFLGAVGGGAAVLAAPGVGTAAAQETNGKVVFTFDDGYRPDYTQTFPIFQQEEVPGCLAIPSVNVGRSEKFLTEGQVSKMVDAGWEVMSHGRAHEALGPVAVTEDVESGDERVYVESTVHARTPNEIEIYAGDARATAGIAGAGEDDTGRYLELESAVDRSFDADDDVQLRFTEEVVRSVLEESKQQLREYGWNTTNLVLPYDRWDQRTLELIPEYYDAVANVYRRGVNGGAAADPYRLQRTYFNEDFMTDEELQSFLDQVANVNGLAILAGHTRNQHMTGERTQNAIQWAKERDLDVVTLQTALEEYGIVESTPTPTETEEPSPTPTESPGGGDGGGGGGGIPIIDALIRWLNEQFGAIFG